ncbi:MAG: helix-turn-helix domain-containing protein [Chloroflexota bacterium]
MSDRLAMQALERANATRPTARLVLVAIALHARSSSTPAWPSLSRLVRLTGLDRTTVWRLVRELEAAGDLTVHRDPDARRNRTANRYLVHPAGARGTVHLGARGTAHLDLGAELGAQRNDLGAQRNEARWTTHPELEGEREGTRRGNARANGAERAKWQPGDEGKLNSRSELIRRTTRESAEREGLDWRAILEQRGEVAL